MFVNVSRHRQLKECFGREIRHNTVGGAVQEGEQNACLETPMFTLQIKYHSLANTETIRETSPSFFSAICDK